MMKQFRSGIGILIALWLYGCTLPFQSSKTDARFLENVSGQDILDQVLFVGMGGPNGVSACPKSLTAMAGKLELNGFPPNSEIAVLAYKNANDGEAIYNTNTGQFLDHWIVRTNSNGQATQFTLLPSAQDVLYYAIDIASGEWIYPCGALVVPLLESKYQCTGSINSPFTTGMIVRLTRPSPGNTPTTDFGIYKVNTERIPAGAVVKIVGGPACNEGKIWWYVAVPNDNPGWVAEGENQDWYITPVE